MTLHYLYLKIYILNHFWPLICDDISIIGNKLETIYCSSNLIQICLQVLLFSQKAKLPYYLPHSGWSISDIMTCHHQIPDNEYDATFPQNNWVDFEYITLTNEKEVQQLRNILHNFTTVSYLKFQDLFLTEKHGLDPKFYQT